jgi:membrane protease YdiL (CAAX protease family)
MPLLAYQPRRPVPWQALDLVAVVIFCLAAQGGVIALADVLLGPGALQPPTMYDEDQSSSVHVVAQLLLEGNPWILMLCMVSAVLVAPVFEEFLYRLLLQGWLETLQRRYRRQMPTLRRLVPGAIGPILLSSLLFARMHFRVNGPPLNARFLVFLLAGNSAAGLLTTAFAVGLLRWRVGATAADFGWSLQKLPRDAGLGLLVFAAVALPIFWMQRELSDALPKYLAPDPFTLFPFALVLGFLYARTHRIAPSIMVHAALNATSLALAWFGQQAM